MAKVKLQPICTYLFLTIMVLIPVQTVAETISRRGFMPGMDLVDFLKSRHPDHPKARPICSNQKRKFTNPSRLPIVLSGYPGQSINCSFAIIKKVGKKWEIGRDHMYIKFLNFGLHTEFKFWRESAKHRFRLMEIHHSIGRGFYYPRILAALKSRYIAHSEYKNIRRHVQNSFGAIFVSEDYYFRIGNTEIQLIERTYDLDLSRLSYVFLPLKNRWFDLIRSPKIDPKKM